MHGRSSSAQKSSFLVDALTSQLSAWNRSLLGDLTDGPVERSQCAVLSEYCVTFPRPMTGDPPARSRTPRAEIARVEQKGFHGWVVTVWKRGVEHQRRFAEESYASPSAAFAAGVRFRNRIVFGAGAAGGPSKKATGIPGISIGSVRTTSGRYVKHYKVSVYGADGKRRGPVFSWLKHGKKRALELAKKALKEGREEARRARRMPKKKTPSRTGDEESRLKSALALSKPTEHRNVRRVDHNHFHGYVVALRRVQARHQKYFSDGVRGGRRAALAQALEYRDALLAELPPPVRIHRRTRNPTGIPGVSLVNDRKRSGHIVPRFVAHWYNAEGRREKRSFSTLEHGFAGAESKAIQLRKEGVEKLIRDRKAMLLEELEERKRRRKKWNESRPNVPPPF